MGTILASASNADGATTTTRYFPFVASSEVKCTCALSSTAPPSQPCRVKLQLSSDASTWQDADVGLFGIGAGITYIVNFSLADYAEKAQQFGYSGWNYYRLVFSGNVGNAVTIAAADNIETGVAVVTLTGLNSTASAALGAWTPNWTGPAIIDKLVVYTSVNSTGAANLFAGAGNTATTNTAGMINGAALAAAANTIIVGGANNSSASVILNANGSVTFTANADTTGYAGKAFITYTKL